MDSTDVITFINQQLQFQQLCEKESIVWGEAWSPKSNTPRCQAQLYHFSDV